MEQKQGFPWVRSYCPHCKHSLRWIDLIPLFSFVFLRGKCRYCRQKISRQYPIVEILTALIFLLIYNSQFITSNEFQISNALNLLFFFYIASSLIVVFVYDLKHYIIPDKIIFPAIIIAFFYRLFENLFNQSLSVNLALKADSFMLFLNYLFAALIASSFLLLIFLVSWGKWIGFGDVKLAVLMGFLLGFPSILVGLFLAFLFGSIIGLWLMVFLKKEPKSEVPFAPFLVAGTFAAMVFGQSLINWYFNFL